MIKSFIAIALPLRVFVLDATRARFLFTELIMERAKASEWIFGESNLEYQVEQFIKSGGQSVKILLSGKTGVGKSHLTNALIGEEFAQEGEEVDPQTDEVS